MSLDVFVTRAGVYPRRYLGYLVVVPPVPAAEDVPAAALATAGEIGHALEDALFGDRLAGIGKPARLIPFGLVEPTAWERRFVAWVANRIGVAPAPGWETRAERDRNPAFVPLAAALADPLAPAPPPSPSVQLVQCDDAELEALAAVRRIRGWLAPQPVERWAEALDEVLVLLPASPERRATWKRVLQKHGVAADVPDRVPLVTSPLGRWLLSLARLARWREEPVHRDQLRAALLGPFVVMPEGARRSDLRDCLRSLRVHRVPFRLWQDHLARWKEGKGEEIRARELGTEEHVAALDAAARRHRGLTALSLLVADRLASGEALFRGLGALLHQLGAANRVRAAGVEQAVDALERAGRILQRLGEEEQARPREALNEKLAELERRLSESSVRSSGAVRHGVRIASYAQYDGRRARFLVLAGLEEGSYPRAPARPSRAEAELAARLRLGSPEEELLRQARIAAAAASRAREQVLLSWSGTDEAGSDTFPGPLLAAVRAREGHPGLPVARLGLAQANPHDPSGVASPADLLAVPAAAAGAALPDGPLRVAMDRARAACDHAAAVDRARAPTSAAALGPYTGKVGLPLGAKRYSPTALESLGQCASGYYLQRVLGVEPTGDEGVDLDPMETGSMLHEALALAAQAAIEEEGAWGLAAADASRAAHVERLGERLATELEAAASRYVEQHPTLPGALVKRVAGRWKRVLEAWLANEAGKPQGGVFPVSGEPDPAKLGAEELDAIAAGSPEVAEALAAQRKLDLAGAMVLLESVRAAPAASGADADRRFDASKARGLVPKNRFKEAAATKATGAREEKLGALAAAAREKARQAEQALGDAIRSVWRTDRLAVPRRVIASEWSFGDEIPEGADPRSTTAPLVIDLAPGRRIEVRGRVDRVDAAADRPDAAVVDYKSGRSKSAPELLRELGQGRHLQLPLYAQAVAKLLLDDPAHPLHVVNGRLDFLRSGTQPAIDFEPDLQPVLVRPGRDGSEPVAIDEVVKAHLAHAIDRLESGVVPLLPRACPREVKSARCACEVVCGFRPEAREMFAGADTQPLFVPPAKVKGAAPAAGEEASIEVDYQEAAPVEDPPPSEASKEKHEQARALARDLGRDVAVSAGAGSGKTRALVDRYTAALEPGCGPENVLCITFTRKATAEMRSRIRDSLLARADGAADPSAMRAWLTALGTAPIQTIDAFAARVVTELGGEEVAVSDAAGGFAAEFVAERMAREAQRPSPALDLLLRELPVPPLRLVLAGLLDEPRLAEAKLSPEEIAQGWDDEAARLAGDLAERVSGVLERARELAGADENAERTLERAIEGLAATELAFEEHGAIAGLWALARARSGGAGSRTPPEDLAALKREIRGIFAEAGDGWFKAAAGVLGGCGAPEDVRRHLAREAGIAHAAMEVARSWLADYASARDERRLASFSDVLARATLLLARRDAAEVRARLPFHHLLVDEFQDTDDAQLRFIRLLQERLGEAGARPSLFVVGDPKQSIYRFRGAEVDQFEEYWERTPEASRASLTVCWRAEPRLSVALSRLFGRLFDARLDPAAAVPWEPLAARGAPGKEPRIDLLVADGIGAPSTQELDEESTAASAGEGDDGKEEEQIPDDLGLERALVRHARALLREAGDGGGESQLAVLTHSWERAIHYGRVLREHGVPAFVQGGRGLLDAREVREVFQWLEALERQDDDLAFAALLRGATVGLSDPGLYAIRTGAGLELRDLASKGAFQPAKARNALSSIRHGFRFDASKAVEAMERSSGRTLDSDVRAALKRDEVQLHLFAEAWAAAAARFGLVPLADLVEQIVLATGYEAVLRSRVDGLQALANLRSFQDLVRAVAAGRSPADAVREIERVATEGEDPAAAGFSLQPGAAVVVTVVHQAKGREWDTVIVPDLHRVEVKGRVAGCDLQRLVRREGKAWVRRFLPASRLEDPADLLATMGGVGAKVLAAATRGAERAELRRLLYVACTRARKRLVLTASWPDAAAFARLAKKGKLGLSRSQGWFDDVVFGLQLQLGEDGRPAPGDGVWQVGRDYRWVKPEGEGFGEVKASPPAPGKVDPAVIRLAAQAVLPEPLTTVNPSRAESTGPAPAPVLSLPVAQPPALGDSPFASASEQGSAFHRAVQLWSYRGECTDAVLERAVEDVVGEWRLAERVARVRQLLDAQACCQPVLLAELREAAARGELFHEVSVGYLRADGARVEGVIDLLYRDAGGDWHVVDYKTDRVGDDAALRVKVAEYYPQVRAYADALDGQLPGGASVKGLRLWMIAAGIVAGWGASP